MGLETPVLLCSFNRPDLTRAMIDRLRQVKPARLVFSVDGPRAHRPEDASKVQQVRSLVNEIDWNCQLTTRFSDTNQGCMLGPVAGMNTAFAQYERAIVLEDDCLPDLSFFRFCEEMLDRYEDDSRIGMITGSRQLPTRTSDASYGFSRYAFIWGWASWRRTWERFDVKIENWPTYRDAGVLESEIPYPATREFFRKRLQKVYAGEERSVWDYQFNLMMWANHMLCVVPETNLIENLGQFHPDATHAQCEATSSVNALRSIEFPLQHPRFVIPDPEADRWVSRKLFTDHALVVRAARKARTLAASFAGL